MQFLLYEFVVKAYFLRRTISSPKERASNTPADDGAFTATLLPWAVVAQKSFAEHSSTSKKDDEVPVIYRRQGRTLTVKTRQRENHQH